MIVSDGELESGPSTVSITVNPPTRGGGGGGGGGRDNSCVTNSFKPTKYQEERNIYKIKASSLAEAEKKFNFVTDDGKLVSTNVAFNFDTDKIVQKGNFLCSNSVLTVKIKLFQPRLTNVNQLSPAAQAEWKRYLAASEAYLDGAVDIIHENFDGVMGKINGKPGGQAIKIFTQIFDETNEALDQYYKETHWGENLGAVLNVNIN